MESHTQAEGSAGDGMSMADLAKVGDARTIGDLEIVISELAAYKRDPEFIAYGLATEVLRFFMNNDWTNQHVCDIHKEVPRSRREGRSVLFTDSQGDPTTHHKHKQKVLQLAECLYNFQDILGINHRVRMLQSENLETAMGELVCARLLGDRDFKLEFIVPSGVKGRDYEAEFSTSAGERICAEIKTKKATTALGQKTVLNTFETARKQFPKGSPGVVLLKIPEHWADKKRIGMEIVGAVEKAFAKTKRIVGTVIVWDQWATKGDVLVYGLRYKPFINWGSPLASDALADAFNRLGVKNNDFYISFRHTVYYALTNLD